MNSEQIIIDLEGSDRKFTVMPDAVVTEATEIADHTWKLTLRVLPRCLLLPLHGAPAWMERLKVWLPPSPPRRPTAADAAIHRVEERSRC